MSDAVPAKISVQLSQALSVIERHLGPTLLAVHLYGSAANGSLKPYSDIDLLVTVTARLDETTRRALLNELLEVSFRGGTTDGKIGLSIYRQGGTERVQLSFPCPPGQARFYREAVSKTRGSDAEARYLDAISNDLAPSRESVLLDLAVNYDAHLRLDEDAAPAITLIVDLPLEGMVS